MINRFSVVMDLVINKKVPFSDTIFLYLTLLPFVLSLTTPMSLMVASLLAFGRLSSDMEVTAFKSSGGHLFQLMVPVLFMAVMLTALLLFFDDRVLPASKYAFKMANFRILQKQTNVAIKERMFIENFEGYKFYIDRIDSSGLFSDVTVFDQMFSRSTVQTTFSKTGWLETSQRTMQIFFHLNNGVQTWSNRDYATYNRLYFDHYTIHLQLENQLSRLTDVKKDFEEMTLAELNEQIGLTADPERNRSIRSEYQKRLALPFSCLALSWFCAPLGLWIRSKGFFGFVIGFVMIFFYYLMFTLGQILIEKGALSPFWGQWWGNILFALAGTLVFYLVTSEHSAFQAFKKRPSARRRAR